MGKVIKVLIIELVITALLFGLGLMLDINLQKPAPEMNGHPAPALTLMLPIGGAALMAVIDIILIIRGIKRAFKATPHNHRF